MGVEQHDCSRSDTTLRQVDQMFTQLMDRTENIHDPLLRGSAQLAIIAPALGYLVAHETIEDIRNARNN